MTRHYPSIILFFLLGLTVASCKKPTEASHTKYITLSESHGFKFPGLVANVREPKIKVCANFDSAGQYGQIVQTIVKAWVGAIQGKVKDKLADGIEYVTQGCHVNIHYDATVTRAYCMVAQGRIPDIAIGPDQPSYPLHGTLSHEFGHAFGLGDTYQAATSGNCQPGQPQSLMCNTSFKEPQEDDINGLMSIYQETFGSVPGYTQGTTPETGAGTPTGAPPIGTGTNTGTNTGFQTASNCECRFVKFINGQNGCGVFIGDKPAIDYYVYSNGQECDANFCSNNYPRTTRDICGGNMAKSTLNPTPPAGLAATDPSVGQSATEQDRADPSNSAHEDACRCGPDITRKKCGIWNQKGQLAIKDYLTGYQRDCDELFCMRRIASDKALRDSVRGCNINRVFVGPAEGPI